MKEESPAVDSRMRTVSPIADMRIYEECPPVFIRMTKVPSAEDVTMIEEYPTSRCENEGGVSSCGYKDEEGFFYRRSRMRKGSLSSDDRMRH
jgi:hypothetical protein